MVLWYIIVRLVYKSRQLQSIQLQVRGIVVYQSTTCLQFETTIVDIAVGSWCCGLLVYVLFTNRDSNSRYSCRFVVLWSISVRLVYYSRQQQSIQLQVRGIVVYQCTSCLQIETTIVDIAVGSWYCDLLVYVLFTNRDNYSRYCCRFVVLWSIRVRLVYKSRQLQSIQLQVRGIVIYQSTSCLQIETTIVDIAVGSWYCGILEYVLFTNGDNYSRYSCRFVVLWSSSVRLVNSSLQLQSIQLLVHGIVVYQCTSCLQIEKTIVDIAVGSWYCGLLEYVLFTNRYNYSRYSCRFVVFWYISVRLVYKSRQQQSIQLQVRGIVVYQCTSCLQIETAIVDIAVGSWYCGLLVYVLFTHRDNYSRYSCRFVVLWSTSIRLVYKSRQQQSIQLQVRSIVVYQCTSCLQIETTIVDIAVGSWYCGLLVYVLFTNRDSNSRYSCRFVVLWSISVRLVYKSRQQQSIQLQVRGIVVYQCTSCLQIETTIVDIAVGSWYCGLLVYVLFTNRDNYSRYSCRFVVLWSISVRLVYKSRQLQSIQLQVRGIVVYQCTSCLQIETAIVDIAVGSWYCGLLVYVLFTNRDSNSRYSCRFVVLWSSSVRLVYKSRQLQSIQLQVRGVVVYQSTSCLQIETTIVDIAVGSWYCGLLVYILFTNRDNYSRYSCRFVVLWSIRVRLVYKSLQLQSIQLQVRGIVVYQCTSCLQIETTIVDIAVGSWYCGLLVYVLFTIRDNYSRYSCRFVVLWSIRVHLVYKSRQLQSIQLQVRGIVVYYSTSCLQIVTTIVDIAVGSWYCGLLVYVLFTNRDKYSRYSCRFMVLWYIIVRLVYKSRQLQSIQLQVRGIVVYQSTTCLQFETTIVDIAVGSWCCGLLVYVLFTNRDSNSRYSCRFVVLWSISVRLVYYSRQQQSIQLQVRGIVVYQCTSCLQIETTIVDIAVGSWYCDLLVYVLFTNRDNYSQYCCRFVVLWSIRVRLVYKSRQLQSIQLQVRGIVVYQSTSCLQMETTIVDIAVGSWYCGLVVYVLLTVRYNYSRYSCQFMVLWSISVRLVYKSRKLQSIQLSVRGIVVYQSTSCLQIVTTIVDIAVGSWYFGILVYVLFTNRDSNSRYSCRFVVLWSTSVRLVYKSRQQQSIQLQVRGIVVYQCTSCLHIETTIVDIAVGSWYCGLLVYVLFTNRDSNSRYSCRFVVLWSISVRLVYKSRQLQSIQLQVRGIVVYQCTSCLQIETAIVDIAVGSWYCGLLVYVLFTNRDSNSRYSCRFVVLWYISVRLVYKSRQLQSIQLQVRGIVVYQCTSCLQIETTIVDIAVGSWYCGLLEYVLFTNRDNYSRYSCRFVVLWYIRVRLVYKWRQLQSIQLQVRGIVVQQCTSC